MGSWAKACFQILLVGIGLLSTAVAAAGVQPPRFTRLDRDDGLSNNTVSAIAEDRRGFIWLGTYSGLNRYDGKTFHIYRHDPLDDESVPHNQINALHVDRQGVLWLGTFGGLSRYVPEENNFRRFLGLTAEGTEIDALAEDAAGEIWAATSNGLARVDRSQGVLIRVGDSAFEPGYARALLIDPAGDFWMGTRQQGLVYWNRRLDRWHRWLHDPADPGSLGNSDVASLYADGKTLWIGTLGGGLNRLDLSREPGPDSVFEKIRFDPDNPRGLSNDNVSTIYQDDEDRVWIGTDGGGLNLFDLETRTGTVIRHDPYDETTLGYDVIRTMHQDRRGDLWVGTYAGGVAFANQDGAAFSYETHRPTDPNSLSHAAVAAILEEEDGTLWVGTDKGGLNRWDPTTGKYTHWRHDPRNPNSLGGDAVLALLVDSKERFWVGTYHGGLHLFDRETGPIRRFMPEAGNPRSLQNPHIWDIHEDRQGNLWLATMNGIHRFEEESETFAHYSGDPDDPEVLAHPMTWDLAEGSRVWVASNSGAAYYDAARDQFRLFRPELPDVSTSTSQQVVTIHEDSQNRLFLGTTAGGLILYDPARQSWRNYQEQDGLLSNAVVSILAVQGDEVWIATLNGLSRIDLITETVTSYDHADGVAAVPLNRNAHTQGANGRLYVGGSDGLTSFIPEAITDSDFVPPIVLTDFQIFNAPVGIGTPDDPLDRFITEAEEIRLRHDHSVLTLSWAALSYRAPDRHHYAYQLENFDNGWIDAGNRRSMTYTNLKPGNYVFRVKGSTGNGVWNETGTSITLTVAPPWWETLWFRTAAVLMFFGLIAGAYLVRTRDMRHHNQRLRQEIVERQQVEQERSDLLREVEAKNQELVTINQELERFNHTVSHDLKVPLITINGFLSLLRQDARSGEMERVEDDLRHIGTAVTKMSTMLDELLELSRAGRVVDEPQKCSLTEVAFNAAQVVQGPIRERDVKVEIDPEMPNVYGDAARLQEAFQNLINNAVKYMADQKEPRVQIGGQLEDGGARCWVRDNGKGIEPENHQKVFEIFERAGASEPGTGLGLALVRRIIDAHDGEIWVESDGAGKGSSFNIRLPGR